MEMAAGNSLYKALRSCANFLLSKKVSTVVLYVAIAVWLAYSFSTSAFFAQYVLGRKIDLEHLVPYCVLLTVAYNEVAAIWRMEIAKKDAIALAVFVLMAWGFFMLGNIWRLCDVALVFTARHQDFRKLMRYCVVLVTVYAGFVITCSQIGVIPDAIIPRGEIQRHCLGFLYCLPPAECAFIITCTVAWLRDRKITWVEIAVLLAMNVGLYMATNSRISFALALLVLIVLVLRKLVKGEKLWLRVGQCSSWLMLSMAVLSFMILGAFHHAAEPAYSWVVGINTLSTNRVYLAAKAIETLGIQPFGQWVSWVGGGLTVAGEKAAGAYNYVDNLYFHALIEYGFVYTVGLIMLYTLVARIAIKQGDVMMPVVIGALSVHFLVDDLALLLYMNTLLLALGSYVFTECNSCKDIGNSWK